MIKINIEQITSKPAVTSESESESHFIKSFELTDVNNEIPEGNNNIEVVKPNIKYIERTSVNALFEQNHSVDFKALSYNGKNSEGTENNRDSLTEEEKAKIREKHPDWPDEIVDAIGSWDEYEIYDKANLKIEYINGKPCLVRIDIDMNQKDADGLTNRQRIERGLAPITKDDKSVELHHIGQKADSPLAELTTDEHRGSGNDTILHNKTKESEINRNEFANERREHWKTRSIEN